MFCPNCGAQIDDHAAFCPSCGAQQQPQQNPVNPAPEAASDGWKEAPAAANPDPWQQPVSGSQPASDAQPVSDSQPVSGEVTSTNPPDYLTVNIVLTVLSVFVCCFSCLSIASLVTGIIGIVSSTQVRSAIQAHNYALAEQKSKAAKNMWIATAVILGVSVVLGIVVMVSGFLGGFMEGFYNGLY